MSSISLPVVVWAGIIELGIVPHVTQGFFCGDKSISYKYTGDTISMEIILCSILVPFFVMWLSEAIFYKPSSIKSTRLRKSLCTSFFWFREYMIGMFLHLFFVETIKVSDDGKLYHNIFMYGAISKSIYIVI